MLNFFHRTTPPRPCDSCTGIPIRTEDTGELWLRDSRGQHTSGRISPRRDALEDGFRFQTGFVPRVSSKNPQFASKGGLPLAKVLKKEKASSNERRQDGVFAEEGTC